MKHEYILKQSRRKTLSISVKPDCTVVVSAPVKASKKQIDTFVLQHSDWIDKQLKRAAQVKAKQEAFIIDYGTQVYFLGKQIPIIAVKTRKASLTDDAVLMPENLDSNSVKKKLIALYKETAKEYIITRLPYYSSLTGATPSKLTISSAKTNWGSCAADRLHFSWHLIMAEKEVIDYVIIHELTHIKHPNHSDAFWYEVSRFCPEWKAMRSKLKFYSEVLSCEGWCN